MSAKERRCDNVPEFGLAADREQLRKLRQCKEAMGFPLTDAEPQATPAGARAFYEKAKRRALDLDLPYFMAAARAEG